jgi:hypothetical protein
LWKKVNGWFGLLTPSCEFRRQDFPTNPPMAIHRQRKWFGRITIMTLSQEGGISCGDEAGALAMENVRHYRAMCSLCRQLAVFDPIHSWKYLIEAQKWEHRAEAEIASHFKECNTAGSSDLARATTTPGTNDTSLKTSAEISSAEAPRPWQM